MRRATILYGECVFNRMNTKYRTAVDWINQSFLSIELKSAYLSLIGKRYEILNTK